MSKIGYFWQQSWLLIVSAFLFGLLMAVTNAALLPRIEKNQADKLNALMTNLVPLAERFDPVEQGVEIELAGGKKDLVKVYKAVNATQECLGWGFKASGQGFADKIEVVVAVDKDFRTLAGFSVLACNETPGFGDRMKTSEFRNQFIGAPAGNLQLVKAGDLARIDDQIVAITGATVTSDGVVTLFNTYLGKIKEQMISKGLIGHDKQQ